MWTSLFAVGGAVAATAAAVGDAAVAAVDFAAVASLQC